MTPLHMQDLEALLAHREGPCVSIYMPTHRTGHEMQQDTIRLKNLLKASERELQGVAIRETSAQEILKPARDLLNEGPFWENLGDGLAVFLAPGFSRIYRLPAPFSELHVVAGAFHVKRLLPIVGGDGRFYVLALSQNEVRLLRGTRFHVEELEPDGMPKSLREALWMDHPEKSLQFHTGSSAATTGDGGSRRAAVFHGQGGPAAIEKSKLERYFRRVDDGLREHLANGKDPLVLAGVDHYFPIYREISKVPTLEKEGVPGNPEKLSMRELHDRAWAIVEPQFRKAETDAIDRYRAHAGQGKTAAGLEAVLPAAHHGRVDTLLVAAGRQQWGAWVAGSGADGSVVIHDHYEQGDRDLLDVAAAATLKSGGRVFPLAVERIPDGADALAILRY